MGGIILSAKQDFGSAEIRALIEVRKGLKMRDIIISLVAFDCLVIIIGAWSWFELLRLKANVRGLKKKSEWLDLRNIDNGKSDG